MADEEKKEQEAPKPVVARLIEIDGLDEHTGFPVYVAVDGDTIDLSMINGPFAYVLTGDGPYIYSDSGIFESFTPAVNGMAGLADVGPQFWYSLNKIPKEEVLKVLGLFHWAYDKHSAEAIVMLYYNRETKEWFIDCPTQEVSAGHCDYTVTPPTEIPAGFDRVGSWHSHGSMSAFHSSVDTNDEKMGDDGIHMTSGDFIRAGVQHPTIVASGVAYGGRFHLNPSTLFDMGIEEKDKPQTISWSGNVKTVSPAHKEFEMSLTKEDSLDFPETWKDKVTAKKVQVASSGYGATSSRGCYTPTASSLRCYQCNNHLAAYDCKDVLVIVSWLLGEKNDQVVTALREELKEIAEVKPAQVDMNDILQKRYCNLKDKLEAVIKSCPEVEAKIDKAKVNLSPKQLTFIIRGVKYREFRKSLRRMKDHEKAISTRATSCCWAAGSAISSGKALPVPVLYSDDDKAVECESFDGSIGWNWQTMVASQRNLDDRWFDINIKTKPDSDSKDPDYKDKSCGDCQRLWAINSDTRFRDESCPKFEEWKSKIEKDLDYEWIEKSYHVGACENILDVSTWNDEDSKKMEKEVTAIPQRPENMTDEEWSDYLAEMHGIETID